MAEPGDPRKPEDDFDDQIGFCSPRSIAGQAVEKTPDLEPESTDGAESSISSDAGLQTSSIVETPLPDRDYSEPAPDPELAAPEPAPLFVPRSERRRLLDEEPKERLTWALTLYALILFAVPTLGFSAILGLLAVTGRTVDASPFLASHYVYQQRTLWIAAIAALVGVILIVVNLGIFVLFVLAVWTIVRGAVGLWRLKNAQPISNPLTWFL